MSDVSKLDKIKEGAASNKNYTSGDLVSDLVPNEIPQKQKGVQIEDANYIDDMYSEEQLERHAKSNINPFTVDGIPSRWEHNKLRSNWHFDTKADPQEETFKVICKFQGKWQAGIDRAVSQAEEQTIGNYRNRGESKQDTNLHNGELMDIKRAAGRDDVSCMYHANIWSLKYNENGNEQWNKDEHKDYHVFHNMLKSIGMYDIHQIRVHIQRLGQVTPAHIDQQMRYARPQWRKRWTEAGADKNPLKLRRVLIALNDWDYGHVWQFGNTYYQGYDAGECIVYDWCNMPHGTANFGYTPRITLQATGFMDDEVFPNLLSNGSKDNIINV